MSISLLLSPNSYDLFCNSLTANSISVPGDLATTTTTVHVFNGATDVMTTTVSWTVKDGICYMWTPTTGTVTLTASQNYTIFNMGTSVGGYIPNIPQPVTGGESFNWSINFLTHSGDIVAGQLNVDANIGGPGLGRISFTVNPSYTIAGVAPDYTYTLIDGSQYLNQQFGILGWAISYPVMGLV